MKLAKNKNLIMVIFTCCLIVSSIIFFNKLEVVDAYTNEFGIATIEMQEDNGNGDAILYNAEGPSLAIRVISKPAIMSTKIKTIHAIFTIFIIFLPTFLNIKTSFKSKIKNAPTEVSAPKNANPIVAQQN